MKEFKLFAFVPLFVLALINIKCIINITQKRYLHFGYHHNPYQRKKNKSKKYAFIGFDKKEYHLINLSKNKITPNNKYIVKKQNSVHVLYSQGFEDGRKELKNNSLNKKGKNLWNKFTSKFLMGFSKDVLIKFFCAGSFCLALYPVYTILINKKIELTIGNIFKENLLCLNIPLKIRRCFLTISLSEFRSSPLFLSTILIASYSLYIILKVYIEKRREEKRIKSAIDAYNKSKDEYINMGTDSTDENDHGADYFDDIQEENYFNKDIY
ncbi:conserved Plasmodium protein, unknown function [Plasmodium gonderi]|uniref:Uncharacterized protein n=1 Tax=Plasmodium gonderi TaxID=77519 RepID=A0A1Y1JI16_PLAGO|nr:conserved Plasmodium protein, unknown function [Plasmodium gonderi]GAW80995.1 conserved Plasmodium protein, unknown function [Plasmodium gonderi]